MVVALKVFVEGDVWLVGADPTGNPAGDVAGEFARDLMDDEGVYDRDRDLSSLLSDSISKKCSMFSRSQNNNKTIN